MSNAARRVKKSKPKSKAVARSKARAQTLDRFFPSRKSVPREEKAHVGKEDGVHQAMEPESAAGKPPLKKTVA